MLNELIAPLVLALALVLFPFELPSACHVRYFIGGDTTQPGMARDYLRCEEMPEVIASVPFYWCAGWTGLQGLSCDRFELEDPPAGQVWMKEIP